MRVAMAADHNGVRLKKLLGAWLVEHGHEVDDRGVHGEDVVDYPPLCADVCREVVSGRADRAIVVGGTGGGEAIACNKISGIRAGLCTSEFLAEISRAHNNSNVLVLGAKVLTDPEALAILATWITTAFKGDRHQVRLDQIAALERGEEIL